MHHLLGWCSRDCCTLWKAPTAQLTVSFNGKARFQKKFAADATNDEIQAAVLADEQSKKYLDGKQVVKVIVVPKKIVNVVIK
jgi:leucyl-tRNA synthetase